MEADSLENEVGAACDNYIVIWQKGTLLLLQKVTTAEQNYNRGSRQLFTNKAALKEWHLWLNVQLSFFFSWPTVKTLNMSNLQNGSTPIKPDFFGRFNFTQTYKAVYRILKPIPCLIYMKIPWRKIPPNTILPESCMEAPVHWEMMDDIIWDQSSECSPPECQPT